MNDYLVDDYWITVNLVPDEQEPPNEVWRVNLLSAPDPVPFDTMDELVAALRTTGRPPPYTISAQRTYINWGASGAVEQVVLTVAEWALEGAVAGATYQALQKAVRTVTNRARAKPRPGFQVDPLTRDEAVGRAQSHLADSFKVDYTDLRLMREDTLDDQRRLFQFEHAEGHRFEVEMLDAYGLALIGRRGWTSAP